MRSALQAGWGWLLAACVALAAQSPAYAEGKRDSAEYQRLVQQALHEYELGNFSEAKAFFAQAHALSPNARTLRGLGMSSYELRHYVEAIGYFDKALNATDRPLTVTMRGEVSQLLKQARGFVAKLRVTLEPSSAELRIDTRPVEKDAAGYIMLDPGTHELVAEAPNYDPATRSIRTDGGEELTIKLTLRSQEEPKPQVAQTQEAPAPVAATADSARPAARHSESSVGPWVLIGVSAAVVVAGGVMVGLMAKDMSTVENAKPGSYFPQYKAANDRVLPLSIAGFTALGVGAAGLIGGIAWKMSTGSASSSDTDSARLDIGPGSLQLSGKF